MNNISLKRIDESNFIECFNLKLAPGQEIYVSDPIRSLAQAYVYYKQCVPFGIFRDKIMVGYVMVIFDYDENTYNIWHLMIDQKYQGRGYGRQAIYSCMQYIATKPFGESDTVLLTCEPENKIAYDLYHKIGFTETGRTDGDEVEMSISISQYSGLQ